MCPCVWHALTCPLPWQAPVQPMGHSEAKQLRYNFEYSMAANEMHTASMLHSECLQDHIQGYPTPRPPPRPQASRRMPSAAPPAEASHKEWPYCARLPPTGPSWI